MLVGKIGSVNDVDFDVVRNNTSRMQFSSTSINVNSNIDINGNRIIDSADPTNPQEVATKNYVDTNSWLINGNALTNDVATKHYADSHRGWNMDGNSLVVNGKIGSVNDVDFDFVRNNASRMQFLPLSTVLTSDLNISGNRVVDSADPENSQDVATKHYVDNKFASKSGATMTGDLYFDGTLNRDVNLIANNIGDNRGFVVGIDRQFSYISFSKYANVNVCQIKSTTFQVFSNTGPILLAANIHGINMYKPLSLNSNTIINVKNPEHPQDVATKHYVDNRRCCNNVGLIPKLTANFGNRSGYIANASSEYNSNYQAYNAFSFSVIALNNGSNEWATANLLNNFWIRITLPVAETIWKFQLTGRFATGAAYFNNWI